MAFVDYSGGCCGNISKEEITKAWATLMPALGDDLRTIISEVHQGVAQLFCIDNELYAVLRVEPDIKELVIVAAAGKNCVKHTREIHNRAKQAGLKTVRLHTNRPDAMLRMGRDLGYQRAETILRAEL